MKRMGAPAEAAEREREGREATKREGGRDEDEEVEELNGPMRWEGKTCVGKRREIGDEAWGEPMR